MGFLSWNWRTILCFSNSSFRTPGLASDTSWNATEGLSSLTYLSFKEKDVIAKISIWIVRYRECQTFCPALGPKSCQLKTHRHLLPLCALDILSCWTAPGAEKQGWPMAASEHGGGNVPVSQLVSYLERKGSLKMEGLNPRRHGSLVSSRPSSVVSEESTGTTDGVTCKLLGFQSFLFSFLYPNLHILKALAWSL